MARLPLDKLISDFFSAPDHVNGTSQVSPTERQSSSPIILCVRSVAVTPPPDVLTTVMKAKQCKGLQRTLLMEGFEGVQVNS